MGRARAQALLSQLTDYLWSKSHLLHPDSLQPREGPESQKPVILPFFSSEEGMIGVEGGVTGPVSTAATTLTGAVVSAITTRRGLVV